MKFSIIIPAFNEEKTLYRIIKKIKKVPYPGEVEIIVIDDGSTDNTPKVLNQIQGIKVLTNKQNHGKGYSLKKGFKKSTGDIILIQDADLEYNPNEHLRLISAFKNNNIKAVFGSRFTRKNHKPRYKLFYLGNIFLSFLTRILYGKNITDVETCYKAFRRTILWSLNLTAKRFDFEPEFTCKLLKKGIDIVEVPISYHSRSYEEGKKIKAKDGLIAIYVLAKIRFFS